jgi:hypothetical protein
MQSCLHITAFRPPVGTPLPMFVYIRLHGSKCKCVDRRRQGDIGIAFPTFAYVRLHQRIPRRHTSPKFGHSRRHTLVFPNSKLISVSAFKMISLLFPLSLIPQSLAQPVLHLPIRRGKHRIYALGSFLSVALWHSITLATRQSLVAAPNLYTTLVYIRLYWSTAVGQRRQT